jgi:hypothetical protein
VYSIVVSIVEMLLLVLILSIPIPVLEVVVLVSLYNNLDYPKFLPFAPDTSTLGTDHLTCKGGYGFSFVQKSFRTTRVRIFIFFLHNLILGYMTKTLNQIFFFLHQNQNIFQQHWESEYFFRKNHNPPLSS